MPNVEAGCVGVDGFSFDVFHHQVGLAVLPVTGIQQSRDVGMRQGCKNLTLCQKTLAQLRVVGSGPQKFHGYALCDLTIHAFGRIDASHAAASQQAAQMVRSTLQVL